MAKTKTGMEELRASVHGLNYCKETFLNRFTAEELLVICRMWAQAEWDFFPDEWEERQVQEALQGIVPRWDDSERPMYSEEEK